MTHIQGHIDDPGGSFGTLILDADKSISISFLPPAFQIKKGDSVGFHPIFNNDHTQILSFNITMWDTHEVAEEMAIQKLGGFTRIEEIYDMANKKAGVQLMISEGGLPDVYRDVLRDVLTYFTYTDFKRFYVNAAGKADSSYAVKQIIAFYKKKAVAKSSATKVSAKKKK